MRIKAHYPQGHPYWQKNEYRIEVDGEFINHHKFNRHYSNTNPYWHYANSYEITFKSDGIYVHYCSCSSGCGKNKISDEFLLLRCNPSDIEFVGEPLEINPSLMNEIKELNHSL